ncbi:uridine phosphorylase [Pseudoalteromonas sp. T1lg10]|uniref:uridine phosphorylase n=1 Tax=Pseudoalteromonas sp. T1lg10 TaxID=2077093 RepID=UPI000CF66051|nr:uridine phosphorylase [Pseudoalteromonas sp. T1lg10]
MKTMFHLGISKDQLNGATLAIIPGAPERAAVIAQQLDNHQCLAQHREFHVYLGELNGRSVVVCSTGIGGPSTSIAVEELAQLGVDTFLRVGTTGAIQPHIKVGELLITHASVRLDGASHHFAPPSYPAVADFRATAALVAACEQSKEAHHIGITASSDTFYPGQERYDTHSGYVPQHLQGSMAQWQALKVMNYEMESATLLTMCSALGLRAGCIAGVLVNRCDQEIPAVDIAAIEQRAITQVLAAAALLLAQ